MKKKPHMSWRMIILNLILPLNLAILMFVLFVQVWFLQFNVDIDGLQSKRYLAEPLLEILDDKPKVEKSIPGWISMVVMEDGVIYYPYEEGIEDFFLEWSSMDKGGQLRGFLSEMVNAIPADTSIVSFTYKGQKGLCFYMDDLLPSAFKVLQKPRYLVNLFLVTTLFFLLGGGIMFNLKRNMEELITATKRFQGMDFDTPLIPRKDNELSDVFVAFDEMRGELKNLREQGLRSMMSITHDLKTPLTSIRGYLEAFRDGVIESPEEAQKVLDILLQKAVLLESRINEILDFSRTVSTQYRTGEEILIVHHWVNELNTYFYEEALLHKRDYSFKEACPEDLKFYGSEKQLSRAVINLFDNARRYTSSEDPIRFSVFYDRMSHDLVIRMEDGGTGVDPDNREKIFDLFFRKDRGRNTRGMGIGLASVKYMTEVHGGSVSCLDSSLGGACFEMRLPVQAQEPPKS